MFIGLHDRSLDDKGRVVLPPVFRRDLEGGAVIAPWDRSIGLWPRSRFEEVMAELLQRLRDGEVDDVDVDTVRRFQGRANEVQIDSQGRFVIPEWHRGYAGIERDVAVVGQTNHVELWDARRYSALEGGTTPEDDSAAIRRMRVF